MVTLYLSDGTPKAFHHPVDAKDWEEAGLAFTKNPKEGGKSSKAEPKEEPKEEPKPKTLQEAVSEYAAPGIIGEDAKPERKAPRRRPSSN